MNNYTAPIELSLGGKPINKSTLAEALQLATIVVFFLVAIIALIVTATENILWNKKATFVGGQKKKVRFMADYQKELALFQELSSKEQANYLAMSKEEKAIKYGSRLS